MWKALINLVNKWGCHHKWEFYTRMRTWMVENDGTKGENPYKQEDTLFCKNCGKFKKIEL